MARHGTRSLTRIHAFRHLQSGCPAHMKPEHGSSTAGIHSMRICEPHGAPNSLNSASERECTYDSPKRGVRQRLLPPFRRALEANRTGPFGPSGVARALLVDTITTRISTASRDACNQGKATTDQVGGAGTGPKHYLTCTCLKLHLKC